MSQWNQVTQMGPEAMENLRHLYTDDDFPIEVRQLLAHWIEERVPMLADINLDDPEEHEFLGSFVSELIIEGDAKIREMDSTSCDAMALYQLTHLVQKIGHRFIMDPASLLKLLRNGLAVERALLDLNLEVKEAGYLDDRVVRMEDTVRENRNKFLVHNDDAPTDVAVPEKILFDLGEDLLQKQNDEEVDEKLNEMSGNLKETQEISKKLLNDTTPEPKLLENWTDLLENLLKIVTQVCALQTQIVDDKLRAWTRHQQLTMKGDESRLDQIGFWCRSLAQLLGRTQLEIERAAEKFEFFSQSTNHAMTSETIGLMSDKLETLHENVIYQLTNLVQSTFIIQVQPPQVLKINSTFTTTVTHLLGSTFVKWSVNDPVTMSLLSFDEARSFSPVNCNHAPNCGCGDLNQNNHFRTPCPANGGQKFKAQYWTNEEGAGRGKLLAHFGQVELTTLPPSRGRDRYEPVTSKKFYFRFQTQVSLQSKDELIQIQTTSLPVILIICSSQSLLAQGTILWDTAFGPPKFGVLNQVPLTLPWSSLARALVAKCRSQTSWSLTQNHVDQLWRILTKSATTTTSADDKKIVTWNQFNVKPMPGRSFTFWRWFHEILKLKDHIDGRLFERTEGFLDESDANTLLTPCHPGMFLIRFSESILGGISITWKRPGGGVFHMSPLTDINLRHQSLAQFIMDFAEWTHIYPGILKAPVFQKFISSATGNEKKAIRNGGYVPFDTLGNLNL